MNKDIVEQILKNDLGWLDDLKTHQFGGRTFLGNDQMPYNVGCVLREKDFVTDWLMQFALGNALGRDHNYFDSNTWYQMTQRGTLCALVVDDDNKPVTLIRPLISNNLNERDYQLLRAGCEQIEQIRNNTLTKNDPTATLGVANFLERELTKKRLAIHELVDAEFYTKYSIIPEAEQKVYYIKDIIREGKAKVEDINRSRDILYRDHRKEGVTAEEYKFLEELSLGEFIIEGKVTVTDTGPLAIAGPATSTGPLNHDEC